MKRQILVFLLVLPIYFFAQNEAKIWKFGNGLGLDFTTSPPAFLTGASISTSVGCASICNAAGNLLFYTDGVTVWDQTNGVMANGTGLLGNPGAQNCVIVKKPSSGVLYYIFTVQGGAGPSGLCYSVVDISLAAGNGSVVAKNVSIYSTPLEEKISATKHCNQTDAWILVKEVNNNNFASVLFTSAGIGTIVASTMTFAPTAASYTHVGSSPLGSMKLSHNGRKGAEVFCVVNPTVPISVGTVTNYFLETFDFDNSTGVLSNFYTPLGAYSPLANNFAFGTEFSPDGTKLYFTYAGGLVQVDFCAYPPGINGNVAQLGDPLPFNNWRSSLQCGPDGKIYVANFGANSLGVINNPNAVSTACNYSAVAISLATNTCGFGLPNFYTPYFEKTTFTFSFFPLAGLTCQTYSFYVPVNCIVLPNSTGPFSGYLISSYSWNFGDLASGPANTSTVSSPTHSFTAPGTYSVQLLLTYLCGRTDTINRTVYVPPTPVVTVLTPTLSCGSTNATLNVVGGLGQLTYTWLPQASSGSVGTNLSAGTHTYFVRDESTGCVLTNTFSTANFVISNLVNTTKLCSYQSAGSATALAFNGSGIYTYSWTGSASTSSTVSGLSPGFYSVTVTDATNNCTVTTPFQIIQSPPIVINVVKSVNTILCTGNSCLLVLTASGGYGAFTYSWTGFPASSTIAINQSLPGTYTYTGNVADNNNCIATVTTSVMYAPTPSLTVPNYTVCAGTSAVISPGGALSYTLQPGGTFVNTISTVAFSTTVYMIVGQNNFCTSQIITTVSALPLPSVAATANSPLCAGSTLSLLSSGAQNYQWSGPLNYNSNTQNNSLMNVVPSMSGAYQVVGTALNGCTNSVVLNVQIHPKPVLQIFSNSPVCSGQNLTFSASGAASYTWSGPQVNSNFPLLLVAPASTVYTGVYTLSGTSSLQCMNSTTANIFVYNYPVLTVNPFPVICTGNTTTLIASGANSYQWLNGPSTNTYVVSPNVTTVYMVKGNNGPCADSTQIKLKVEVCAGLNELLVGSGIEVYPNPAGPHFFIRTETEIRFTLYATNGQLIQSGTINEGVKEIMMDQFPAGIYLLHFEDLKNGTNFTHRVVHQE